MEPSLVYTALSENTYEVVASRVSTDKKRDRKETSAQIPPESVPRKSDSIKKKSAWQESGEYCTYCLL